MTRKTISIQPGQPGEGMGYNPHLPLPYPFHVDSITGDCLHGRGTAACGDAPEGRPWRLVGFQRTTDQHLDVTFEQFVADPTSVVGCYPVFAEPGLEIFSLNVPITGVQVHEHAAAVTR
jgi:hypothetical protein